MGEDRAGANAALLAAMLEASDVIAGVMEVAGEDYRYVLANRATSAFWNRSPEEMSGATGRELGVPEDQIRSRVALIRHCAETGRPAVREYPFSVPGVGAGWFLGAFSPLPQVAGRPPRMVFMVIDITSRKEAELNADAHGERLALALEVTGLGLWEYDIAEDVVRWDARVRSLFGVAADQPLNFQSYLDRVHPGDVAALQAAYEGALEGRYRGDYKVEHRVVHEDGTVRWVRGAGRVLFDRGGEPVRVLGTAQDITDEVVARERQALLLGELNHRVKNNLAAVQAMASQTFRATQGDPAAFRDAFQGRLFSMSRAHDLLTRRRWEDAELDDVVQAALAPFKAAAITVKGEAGDCRLPPQLAVDLVMVLHELATNAAKYGALSSAHGRVVLDWRRLSDGAIRLSWAEAGGPTVAAPSREGFGTRLVRSVLRPHRGSADLRFPPEGVRCELTIPWPTP